MNTLLRKAEEKDLKITILGMGYIGLPTAIAFARAGFTVNGFDVNKKVIETLKIDQYTLDDIIDCLIKPNRSIRDQYQTPLLKKDILHIEDLKPGMVLEGTVRNVVDFGAFVDIGLKNDGLVHISKMSKQRIKHPLDVLSIGDIVEVNVIDVDLNKKRVSLSMI